MTSSPLFPTSQKSQEHSKVETLFCNKPMLFPNMEDNSSEFTLTEIIEMEKSLFKELKEASLNPETCQKLASQFSFSSHRKGRSSIKWNEVHAWFQERQEQEIGNNSMKLSKELKVYSPVRAPNIKHKTSIKSKVESAALLQDLLFEAKSARDLAWNDVGSFLSYKVSSSVGELLVRVRFAGFDNSNDEWVNVEREVRDRSIPLDDSECHLVEVGDRVLCYRKDEDDIQKDEDEDMYFDEHVVRIDRNLHDLEPCSCNFEVRYDHDSVKENVDLRKLCRRPS